MIFRNSKPAVDSSVDAKNYGLRLTGCTNMKREFSTDAKHGFSGGMMNEYLHQNGGLAETDE